MARPGLPDGPAERFFVRNHTATPLIDAGKLAAADLRLGPAAPARAIELGLRELRRLPSATRAAFIECAGNGRSFFAGQQGTPATGSQWRLGAVGVARWRGVPLRDVLERAGIARRAIDVMPQGLDATVVTGGVDQGHVRRPLPVDKALDDVLLAYEMNGEATTARPRVPGAPRRPGLGRDREHQVAGPDRGLRPAAVLALEHDPVPDGRPGLPRRRAAADRAAGQERVRAAVAARPCRPGAGSRSTGGPGRATAPIRAGRRASRGPTATRRLATGAVAWPEPAAGVGALEHRLAPCTPRRPRAALRARPTAPARGSPTRCRSTPAVTSSGRSCATR